MTFSENEGCLKNVALSLNISSKRNYFCFAKYGFTFCWFVIGNAKMDDGCVIATVVLVGGAQPVPVRLVGVVAELMVCRRVKASVA